MRKRPITALMAALALLAVAPAASFAQSPTPTATAAQDDGTAADPPADASKEVKAVYSDYSRDGVIDVCEHARAVLQEALDRIEADFDRDFPDFREARQGGHPAPRQRPLRRRRRATATRDRDRDADRLPDRPTATPDDGRAARPTTERRRRRRRRRAAAARGRHARRPRTAPLPEDGALPDAGPPTPAARAARRRRPDAHRRARRRSSSPARAPTGC